MITNIVLGANLVLGTNTKNDDNRLIVLSTKKDYDVSTKAVVDSPTLYSKEKFNLTIKIAAEAAINSVDNSLEL